MLPVIGQANSPGSAHIGHGHPGYRRVRVWADASGANWATQWWVPLVAVFLAYYFAGRLGQATTSIRSSNLGPVWPAYGIAVAALLRYGYGVWPAVAASAFVVAVQGSVSASAAAGQAAGATLAAASSVWMLRRSPGFDPTLARLRDALRLVVFGAFGSALISASIGVSSLYATGIQAYAGLPSAWVIYWLGDSTGVLLVTPLVFTLPGLLRVRSLRRGLELAALLSLLTVACFVIFADWSVLAVRLHVLAFAVLPFVMWGAINFGVGGAALATIWIAAIATVLTALGSGPFAQHTPFVNAVLLDVLFTALAVSGLALASVIAEREGAEREREAAIREQAAMEARLHLATIVESSDDAIWSHDLDGTILSWNPAAARMFGFTPAEAIGRTVALILPPELMDAERKMWQRLIAGERIVLPETIRMTKAATPVHISLTVSPLRDPTGTVVGAAKIARDISEQQRAREALSAVNRRLIEAQEQERSRIARELHDDIGQRLALVLSELAVAADRGTPPDAARLQSDVAQISADVQTLSHDLHSARLELLGIGPAVRLFCRTFAEQQNVAVAADVDGVPRRVPSGTSLAMYRVLQEALHNGVKHSGARHFDVRLWAADSRLHLAVSDRGSGFDVPASRRGQGIGLVTMDERMKLVSGELSIESSPHQGTRVHASAPL
jgi:PAS domain S-box-containing protein